MIPRPLAIGFSRVIAATVGLLVAGVATAADESPVDFGRQIQPILARQCFSCHGPGVQEAGLKLNQREAAFALLESGSRAVVPGKPDESELLKRIAATDESERMPPSGKPVSPANVELIRRWISQGAKWDEHWAFRPIHPPAPPKVKHAEWGRHPIDAFIAAKLEAKGLAPNPPADKLTLLRRATYDLTGLPPTEAEIDSFLTDDSSAAFEKVVDRLLASERYGERWGRHWLDLVRFAETNSYERDGPKPNAWRYRDYVIRSFNNDKPYDRFLLEQLAGDELPDRTPETIIASGYLRLGVWQDEPVDLEQSYYDEMDDIVATTSQAFLGLTINCARCHDHKIDPIQQADYYRILSFFHDVPSYGIRADQLSFNQTDISSPEVNAAHAEFDRRKKALREQMEPIEQRGIVKMSAEDQRKTEGGEREKVLAAKLKQHLNDDDRKQYAELKTQWDELVKRPLPPRESALSVARCLMPVRDTFLMQRGNPHAKGDKVQPGYPAIFESPAPKLPEVAEGSRSSGRRTVLAQWITSPDNRLASRVLANRVWQFHFGRGIVRSSNNFGLLGEPPTHPELLDWLAATLKQGSGVRGQESGQSAEPGARAPSSSNPESPALSPQAWRLKPLHRLIMLSRAYQMSSAPNPDALAKDPRNDLFWRFDMRRLSAEELRDSIYAVTGRLNLKMYGQSMYPELTQEVLSGQSMPGSGWGVSSPEEQARRSVYIFVKRSLVPPMLSAFDFPDTDTTCEARFITTQPAQALGLMNGKFLQDRARDFAARLRKEAGDDPRKQVGLALRLAFQRPPDDEMIDRGAALLRTLKEKHKLDDARALDLYALTVLNLNAFVYLD